MWVRFPPRTPVSLDRCACSTTIKRTSMKTRIRQRLCRFELQVMAYGNRYYIERVAKLESALARKPRVLQIDLIGVGEILADFALIFRSTLMKRSSKTRIITNACSSLQGGSVLVWLMGETRLIRE